MNVAQLRLNNEQYHWVNHWLERWGAWVYSGRLEKPQSSIIAHYMAKVNPQESPTRLMCNDDDGLLISRVVDTVMRVDIKAFKIVLSYYVQCTSRRAIANYYHHCASPRKMNGRGGDRVKKPSFGTCRNEIDAILEAAVWLLYQPLQKAFDSRKPVAKIHKTA
ncbi:antiterminator Q family protein [Candidatus Fukatsuia symbiotica]|uniref:Antiterminator n=1 Tax=Candidatus Fukatsuia symbiotica TaxID=1878942 RepID=A0A2Y9CKD9_9GAMM|nr:antiterminator Q family protein [Candidatus Fukatsuia symbiotica]AWK15349.1 antiterminator [Candidatus Fukatsuia symbiotica]MEA9446118.1 antiterminator Q family protein [Candidatus Fukatsuia symbiotica]